MDNVRIIVWLINLLPAVGLLIFGFVGHAAYRGSQGGSAASFGRMFEAGNLWRIVIVVAVIVAVVDLAILGLLSEGVLALFGSVLGFVLAGFGRSPSANATPLPPRGSEPSEISES